MNHGADEHGFLICCPDYPRNTIRSCTQSQGRASTTYSTRRIYRPLWSNHRIAIDQHYNYAKRGWMLNALNSDVGVQWTRLGCVHVGWRQSVALQPGPLTLFPSTSLLRTLTNNAILPRIAFSSSCRGYYCTPPCSSASLLSLVSRSDRLHMYVALRPQGLHRSSITLLSVITHLASLVAWRAFVVASLSAISSESFR